MRARNILKIQLLTLLKYAIQGLICCFYFQIMSVFAVQKIGYTENTKPILGYPPSIKSIAASELTPYLSGNDQPFLIVGSQLAIQSGFCDYKQSEVLESYPYPKDHEIYQFLFLDEDLDDCLIDEDSLKWFMLDPKDKSWNQINTWEDLDATEINNTLFPNSILLNPSQDHFTKTPILSIPEAAAGKRIGFTFIPKSKTGRPNEGSMIKAWDLNYYFGQASQKTAGIVIQDDGNKLDKTNYRSGGGWILESTQKPQIKNLRLRGEYRLNQSITAEFDFEPNTTLPHKVQQFIVWGELGTTANPENLLKSTSYTNQSPPLTEKDIAGIIEVSILPKIIVLDEIEIVGDIATQSALDDGNDLDGFNPFTEPEIENLILEGNFAVNNTIQVKYDLIPHTTRNYLDRSMLWWGAEGTTKQQIQDGVAPRSTVFSPPLTEEDMNTVYEVSMIPRIELDKDTILVGKMYTRTTSAEGNNLIFAPKITDLTLVNTTTNSNIVDGYFFLNHQLGARYVYKSDNNLKDQSEYKWSLDPDTVIAQGTTTDGIVPNINFLSSYSGKTIQLTLTPKDQNNNRGKQETVTTQPIYFLPMISNLELQYTPNSSAIDRIFVDDKISAKYSFIPGTNSIDMSRYSWQRTHDSYELSSGTISAGSSQIPDFTITEQLAGSTITLKVQAEDANAKTGNILSEETPKISHRPKISNLQLHYSATGGTQFPPDGLKLGDLVSALYQFVPGESTVNSSTFSWQFEDGTVIKSGTTNNGQISGFTITHEFSEKMVYLVVAPKDGLGVTGKEEIASFWVQKLPPNVDSIRFTYSGNNTEPDILRVGMKIGATYRFIPGSSEIDNSIYEWRTSHNGVVVQSGTIQNNQHIVPEFEIPASAANSTLQLSVIAKDGDGMIGNTDTASTKPIQAAIYKGPTIRNLRLIYPDHGTQPTQLTSGMKIAALYDFMAGDNPIDQSEYEWRMKSNNTLLDSGQVVHGLNRIPDFIIPTTAIGSTIELIVMGKDGDNIYDMDAPTKIETTQIYPEMIKPRIANVRFNYPNTSSPPAQLTVGTEIQVLYDFVAGSNPINQSVYEWQLRPANLVNSGTVDSAGNIPILYISSEALGNTLYFKITPKDGAGNYGDPYEQFVGSINGNKNPSVTDMRFIYDNPAYPMLQPGGIVRATYRFVPGSNPIDKTIYEMRASNSASNFGWGMRPDGDIQVKIPEYVAGQVIIFTLTPRDDAGGEGDPVSISSVPVGYLGQPWINTQSTVSGVQDDLNKTSE